jgi:hypothetical protein
MSDEAILKLSRSEAGDKAKTERYLAETLSILRELALERKAHKNSLRERRSVLEEVKAILRPA